MIDFMDGITLTPLKIIEIAKGNVMHALKSSDSSFSGFGESYFSTIECNQVKGWKKHTRMVSTLIVPVGEVRFVFYDDRENSQTKGEFFECYLSLKNYRRLTVQPGIWMAFQGIGKEINLVMNIASIEHDPTEGLVQDVSVSEIKFDFGA